MKLTLDHTQRLNLHALLGAQRSDVGSIRAIWAVQDELALDADEEKAIELKRELVNGQERTLWNSSLSIPAKEYDFMKGRSHASELLSRRGNLTLPVTIAAGCSPSSRGCSQPTLGRDHTDVGRSVPIERFGQSQVDAVEQQEPRFGMGVFIEALPTS